MTSMSEKPRLSPGARRDRVGFMLAGVKGNKHARGDGAVSAEPRGQDRTALRDSLVIDSARSHVDPVST